MKVLVGVDLQIQGHDWLLQRATHLAESIDGRVDLVYVVANPTAEHRALLAGLITMVPAARRGAARVEAGDAADTLITLTADYDVMVVGPREPNAIQRWINGPMAVRVLRRSRCPILVPRAERLFPKTPRILCGLDVRGLALDEVLEFSITWTGRLGGTLDSVYAVSAHIPTIRNKEMRDSALRELMANHGEEKELLAKMMEAVPASHRGEHFLEVGEPEDVLVKLSSNYDLVLVGNRGRTGITRLLMGNVANHVVRTAHCDVLVLPTAALVPES